jgi:hypothetical protein
VKFSRLLLGLVLATSIYSFQTALLPAQSQSLEANRALMSTGVPAAPPTAPTTPPSSTSATATIVDGATEPVVTISGKGMFGLVGIKHDHTVDIAIQYPVTKAGHSIVAEPLDGGQVIANGKSMTVGADGTIHFKYRVGHEVGVYEVSLRDGTQELGLQFWVLDEQHPGKNRPVVNPEN